MSGYIVMWSDFDGGFVQPYMWDEECPDVLTLAGEDDDVAFFESKEDARKAINVSVAFAKFQRARGKPANDDFVGDNLKKIKLWRVKKKEQKAT